MMCAQPEPASMGNQRICVASNLLYCNPVLASGPCKRVEEPVLLSIHLHLRENALVLLHLSSGSASPLDSIRSETHQCITPDQMGRFSPLKALHAGPVIRQY